MCFADIPGPARGLVEKSVIACCKSVWCVCVRVYVCACVNESDVDVDQWKVSKSFEVTHVVVANAA